MKTWTCAPGWLQEEVAPGTDLAHRICVPPAQSACPDGQAQFLGEAACRALGTACPAGAFLDETALRSLAPSYTGKIIYVDPASPVGDGSRGSPLPTVSAALSAAAKGDIVALAKRTLTEAIRIGKSVALVGSCVDGTTVVAPSVDEQNATLFVFVAGNARVANLRISGPRVGLWVNVGAALSAASVEVKEAMGSGILFTNDTSGDLQEIVVRDTRSRASNKTGGLGLNLGQGAKVTVSRGLFERNRSFGVNAQIPIAGRTPVLELTDVVIRDTRGAEKDGADGFGILFANGGQLTLRRTLLERNRNAAFMMTFTGAATTMAEVELEHVVVRDTEGRESDGLGGGGIMVAGSRMKGQQVLLQRNRSVGLWVHEMAGVPRSVVELTDVVVRETLSQTSDATRGEGIVAMAEKLTLTRAFLDGNRTTGLTAFPRTFTGSPAPAVELSDIVVQGTQAAESDSSRGWGISLAGVEAKVARVYLARNRTIGLYAGIGGTIDLSDLTVRDTGSQLSDLRGGNGLVLTDGIQATVRAARLEGNRETSVLVGATVAEESAPKATLESVVVVDTQPAECAQAPLGSALSCVEGPVVLAGGTAVAVVDRGEVELRTFDISRSYLAGVQVGRSSLLTLRQGAVHENAVGANVQVEEYDLSRLLDPTVRYYDNETNLHSDALPLPQPPAWPKFPTGP
jgi:hypothetical protein